MATVIFCGKKKGLVVGLGIKGKKHEEKTKERDYCVGSLCNN